MYKNEKYVPAAKPSNILFLRSTGWLLVLMRTPAWAFLKISFSSNKPVTWTETSSWETAQKQRDVLNRECQTVTSSSVEDTDSSVSPVVDLVSAERGIAVGLDPHSSHGVVKDLVVFYKTQAWGDV